jgi:hypothetical protein
MEGATQCMPCAAGQFTGKSSSTACELCPIGTYAPEPGSQRCLPCRAGLTTASMGATGADDCALRVVLNAAPQGIAARLG